MLCDVKSWSDVDMAICPLVVRHISLQCTISWRFQRLASVFRVFGRCRSDANNSLVAVRSPHYQTQSLWMARSDRPHNMMGVVRSGRKLRWFDHFPMTGLALFWGDFALHSSL
jgi:hypothetical protein